MKEFIYRDFAIFTGMIEQETAACLRTLNGVEHTFEKGEIIFHAGENTERMGMVVSGSVTIESNDVLGNCTILSHVGAGQYFAETYAFLANESMLVDVRANEDCKILFLTLGNPLASLPSSSWKEKLMRNLLRISSRKNLTLSGRSFHTAPKSCRARILAYLNSVSLQTNSCEFDIPFDRQQLADYLNLERTSLSKELARMREERTMNYHSQC